MTKRGKKTSQQTFGEIGERLTADYLKRQGYRIVDRNYRCRFGEIDIVAEEPEKGILCFVEVKTRSGLRCGLPCEAVTSRKLCHIRMSAFYYTANCRPGCGDYRVDVAEVLRLRGKYYIRYTENV